MSILDSLAQQAGKIANDVQGSLRRARVEGERRLLQRQHRAALEELGERTYELVRRGELPEAPLSPEIAAVESKLMELEAKVVEAEDLRTPPEPPAPAPASAEPAAASAPAVDGAPAPGPGPGWEAAERFFRKDA
ncbi:MAG: hypothetical protein IT200_14255 [Thermoleophilia bacterium]|nr:hypothetical protein [Thermoleophilia bacterium]